ncbi:MAG: AtpZ/AtpI family protein [Patescibacteria group bacterium]|nr:AtpZ/AtpI family protein [Patescibacteria group bacterium]
MSKEKKKKLWWKPAITIAINISGWVAGPIIIALFLGKHLDKKYDTAPWIFIGLTIIAFIISITAIWKILKKYLDSINNDD